MRRARLSICLVVVCVVAVANTASADTFGSGGNQFAIDFVPISGSTNPASGYGIVNNDYRMGTYEISNDQWNKFKADYGTVAGNPWPAYSNDPEFTGANVPTNNVSWYEAAQFVNYLNTSTGHQAAYKFTGIQGTNNYTFTTWTATDTGYNVSNPYRNSNAFYFLPTEDEWVKAAYWNGTSLQAYATKAGETVFQGNGTNGGWNYYNNGFATNPRGPWNVRSGSEELNGTYNMMGNILEWTESPWTGEYWDGSNVISLRGGSYIALGIDLPSSFRDTNVWVAGASGDLGFRVASVPEPATLLLLGMGGLMLRKRRV